MSQSVTPGIHPNPPSRTPLNEPAIDTRRRLVRHGSRASQALPGFPAHASPNRNRHPVTAAILAQLKADAIVRSPYFNEAVRVVAALPVGDSVKLIGAGMSSGRFYEPILSPAQLAELQIAPERPPHTGNGESSKLGVEAMRLGLA